MMEVNGIAASDGSDAVSLHDETLIGTENSALDLHTCIANALEAHEMSRVSAEKHQQETLTSPKINAAEKVELKFSMDVETSQENDQLGFSSVKATLNCNTEANPQEKANENESEEMQLNGMASSDQIDAVSHDKKLVITENSLPDLHTCIDNVSDAHEKSDVSADEYLRRTSSPKMNAADKGGLKFSMDVETSLQEIENSGHSSASENPVCNNDISFSGHSTPLHVTADAVGTTPLEISTPDSEMNTFVDISDDSSIIELSNEANDEEQKFEGSHRGAVVPYSDTEDSGSSSSSSSSDSDDSDSESTDSDSANKAKNPSEKEQLKSPAKPIKVHGELDFDELPPIQDLHISVRNDQVVEIGKVLHAVDSLVVVECYKDQPPLDIDSVLFLDRGSRPLGRVFDVMGPVTEPLYCVRFNSKEHIEEQNIKAGMLVYSAPQTEYSNFVFLKHLMMLKGSDASWKRDLEVPSCELDFSDDDEEAQIRKTFNSNKTHTPKNSDEPKPKAFKSDKGQASSIHQPHTPGYQGSPREETRDRFRPRNPWGWSGPRHSYSNNSNQFQPLNQQNQFNARAPVRPSSFNVDSTYQARAPSRGSDSNGYQYPNNTQFGRESDPSMFSQLPEASYNTYSSSWSSASPYEHHGHGYAHSHEHMSPMPSQFTTAPSPEDQRYSAFQSEISRLVDAYNSGADSPMAVPPPPFDSRSTAPTAAYGSRPPGPPLHFGSRPPGPSPQFGSRPPGPPPQFGSRPSGPPPHFGLRPPGPPPQFGSRPPGPPQYGGNHASYENYY